MQVQWDGSGLARYPLLAYPQNVDVSFINVKEIPKEIEGYSDPVRGILSLVVDTTTQQPPAVWCYTKLVTKQPKGAIACIVDELRASLGLDKWGMHWTYRSPYRVGINEPLVYLYMYRQGWTKVENDPSNITFCIKMRKMFCLSRIMGIPLQEKNVHSYITAEGELRVLPRYENFCNYDSSGVISTTVLKKWFNGPLTVRKICAQWFMDIFPELKGLDEQDFIERATHIFQHLLSGIIQRVDPRLCWIVSDAIRRLRECLTF